MSDHVAKSLEFFTDSGDLSHLVRMLAADPFMKKFAKLNKALVGVIEDFPFVGFHTLNIQDKDTVVRLLAAIDKSNGYMFVNTDATNVMRQNVYGQQDKDPSWTFELQQKYINKS